MQLANLPARPVFLLVAAILSFPARAEVVVVANENKVAMGNGVLEVRRNRPPDNITILDLAGPAPRVVGEVELAFSMVGPPFSVAVTPDEGLALVTAANRIDPANPTQQVPDNKLTVVDLKAAPPRVIATLETGLSPSGVAVNPQGTLARWRTAAKARFRSLPSRGSPSPMSARSPSPMPPRA